MFNIIKNLFKTEKTDMFAMITETTEGFRLSNRYGEPIPGLPTYSRARDARRGATRRGFAVA